MRSTYTPVGTPGGRGIKRGDFHGDATTPEFAHCTMVKESGQMGIIDWDARTDRLVHPIHFWSDNRRVKTLHPGATVYKCLGHFRVGALEAPEETQPASTSSVDPARTRSEKGPTHTKPTLRELLRDIKVPSSGKDGKR